MNRSNWREEVIGLISLILGLPSFLLLVLQGQIVIGILVGILCLLTVIVVWLRFDRERPALTTLKVVKELTINDKNGSKAVLLHRVQIRANRKGVDRFCFSGISSDGTIDPESIEIDGQKPNEKGSAAGLRRVCKIFPPMQRGDTKNIVMSIPAINAFPSEEESLVHGVNEETKLLKMVVNLPADRTVRDAWSCIGVGGDIKDSGQAPEIDSSFRRLEIEFKNPKEGIEYSLCWRW